jgi:diguanylate cyclase (GGDEF)-like protein
MANQAGLLNLATSSPTLPFQFEGHYDADARMRLLSRLQTTLDPLRLLQLYFAEVRELLAVEGLRWRHEDAVMQLQLGRREPVQYRYQLSLGRSSFGELAVSRCTSLLAGEERLLEQTLDLLIQPLCNAVRYQQAVVAARRDSLTGLDNRTAFDQALSRELELTRRHGAPFSLLLLDVDRFKDINDRYGHLAGDAVLRDLAGILVGSARQSDLLFRYAGDEFVIVMSRTGRAGGWAVAERVRRAVARHVFRYGELEVPVRISLGVAVAAEGEGPQALFQRADQALLAAKRQGRDRVGLAAQLERC